MNAITLELQAIDISMDYRRAATTDLLRAIDGLNLDVGSGRFVSVVGPSGCGKTTLLKILAGLLRPTGGTVLLRGRPVRRPGRGVAMVFQEASLFPWYTLIRNVAYGLECQGVSRADARRRAERFIELVGLSGFEGHYPHELSGGMQQRANLARALAVEPHVLLMDEPFAALDAQTRELMQVELLDVWAQSATTVLFVTHQIGEAVFLSDRVAVLSARPARIVEEIDIDLPRPRDLRLKRARPFLAYEDRIWGLIEGQARRALQMDRLASEEHAFDAADADGP